MCSLRKNVDSSICAAFKDLTSIISTTPIVVALAIARVIVHPKPLINLRQYALISRTIRVRPGHIGEMNARSLSWRVRTCEATCYRFHLRIVARARKMPARQVARDVRRKWLIRIGSSVIPRVQSLPGMLPQLNRAVIELRACTIITCSLLISIKTLLDSFKIVLIILLLIIKFLKQIFLLQ